jgi:hypothetical protein
MINRLLGIKTLEKTEPVELEEVDISLAPRMPAEYDHTVPLTQQAVEPEALVVDEKEPTDDDA